jgi:mono/diheme cytochrome c family protein
VADISHGEAPNAGGLAASAGFAQETADFFGQNCISCHTVGGGRLTGADLKNVTPRKEREWLIEYLQNPPAGRPVRGEAAAGGASVVMPTIAGMTKDRAQALLTMLDAESKLAKSQLAGMSDQRSPVHLVRHLAGG